MKMAVHNLYSASAGSLPAVKIPKKRGRKPGYKLKSRVLMTPLALSPPRSTPEPDLSSIPQDAATIPSLAAPQALTVCLYINKQANAGPYLERRKVQQLPEHFGPERPSAVLQQAVQACIDCAHQQKLVFSLVKQGYGGEMVSGGGIFLLCDHPGTSGNVYTLIYGTGLMTQTFLLWVQFPAHLLFQVSASFDGKQHLRSLPVVNTIGYVLRFLAKLCRSLLCDDLFSHQPFPRGTSASEEAPESQEDRMESGFQVMSVLLLVGDHTLNEKVCADGVLLPEVNLFQVFSKIRLSVLGWCQTCKSIAAEDDLVPRGGVCGLEKKRGARGGRVVRHGGTCANPGEKEEVCSAGEESERKERMMTGKFPGVA
nr:sex comb on midleg-like protein 4 isoform X3 [Globicephala melas]